MAGFCVFCEIIAHREPAEIFYEGPLDMPNLLQHAISQEQKVGVFPIHEYWMDLGSPEELKLARNTGMKKATPPDSGAPY